MDWLEPLTTVARLAGGIALRHFRTNLRVETKADGSPVTLADRAAEDAARTWILQRFAGDEILGEEHGTSGVPNATRRWVIDPIDGTKTFIHGVPLWGTMVGVIEQETVVAGAIYCPAVDELVVAAHGAGCWHNGTRCSVSEIADLSAATILTTSARFTDPHRRQRWIDLSQRVKITRTWGDCFGYLLLASGRAEVMVDDRLNIWDYAPLLPIVREAGGVITDWHGGAAYRGGAIATNAALSQQVRDALMELAGATSRT
jgi:histidinol phosphatase-like enzyme (inositol monophosphatase family)